MKRSIPVAYQGYKTPSEIELMHKDYINGTLKRSPREGLLINPKVAYVVTEKDIIKSIPYEWIKKNTSVYGVLSKVSEQDPVSNLQWDYLHFVNSDVFRPAAIAFEKSEKATVGTKLKPSYTPHIKGTKAYKDFWRQEFDRIVNGYEPIVDGIPCGVRISGEFYFYLNYCRIKKIVTIKGVPKDVEAFPSFLAMDYYYYKELEARESPERVGLGPEYRKSLVVCKSRRKGMSFKAAAGSAWIICFNNKARVGIASEPHSTDETDAVKCAKKVLPIIDHLSAYTPFGRTEPGDPQTNGGWKHEVPKITRAQFSMTLGLFNTKTKEKQGRQSTLFTMSLSKDDAASGEGLHRLYIEESGKVANLDKVWVFSRESMKAGSLFKGVCVIFGTGGEMVSASGKDGSSKAFSALFYNPEAAELAAFDNIYEYRDNSKKSGYFICDMWSNFGSYVIIEGTKYLGLDDMGNAYFWAAELALNKERLEKMPPRGKQSDYNRFLTQRCKTPSEAFLVTASNTFNTADLISRRNEVKMSRGGFEKYRMAGELVERANGKVDFVPDLQGKLLPITTLSQDVSEREGCLLIYEHPKTLYGEIPEDAYIISVDTIGQNNAGGDSLNSVIVMKTPKYALALGTERVVATYHGRAKVRPLDFLHRLLVKLSRYYNARITFENDRDGGILAFFNSNGLLNRLLPFPSTVTKKVIPNSKTLLREFGHSMASPRHLTMGEQYTNEWLDYRHPSRKAVNEAGEVVEVLGKRNLDLLEDELLIEQLINYSRDINLDAAMAFFGIMVQFKEIFPTEIEDVGPDDYIDEMQEQLFRYYDMKFGGNSAEIYKKSKKNPKNGYVGAQVSSEYPALYDEDELV